MVFYIECDTFNEMIFGFGGDLCDCLAVISRFLIKAKTLLENLPCSAKDTLTITSMLNLWVSSFSGNAS